MLQTLLVGGRVQIFGNKSVKSKLHAWINEEHTEVRECLLSY
jgi:hypothetical protein